ncbi:MAG: hypothetical protein COB58_07020 [Thalassobium sp.]|nr:MAG: hypothetical protein COB43_01335 [Oceanospirillales bacterium]PHQ86987.1 MAG: hypothetical protein COB58_07020 [Thalassobium sp.]
MTVNWLFYLKMKTESRRNGVISAITVARWPLVGAKLFREGVANGISISFIDVFADKIRSYDLNISPVGGTQGAKRAVPIPFATTNKKRSLNRSYMSNKQLR